MSQTPFIQPPRPSRSSDDFDDQLDRPTPGLIFEFWDFVRDNKKWWLIPILVALLPVGILVILFGTAAAPFLHPLF